MPHAIFGIDRLIAFVLGQIDLGVDLQHVILEADIQVVLLHAWHFEDHAQRVVGLIDVGGRDVVLGRNGLLLLGDQLLLFLDFQCLCLRHVCLRPLAIALVDFHLFGFVALGARQEQRQYAVAILGLGLIGIDVDRQRQGSVKLAGQSFAPVQAGLLR